ncbi:hypothetical protein [uncultured Porphyromonas sp.]|nr:hypothetical protein [uncultured Porphyromonas sp.]
MTQRTHDRASLQIVTRQGCYTSCFVDNGRTTVRPYGGLLIISLDSW